MPLLLLLLTLAAPLEDAAREFAARIVAFTGRDPVTVSLRNVSSLNASDAARVRDAVTGRVRAGDGGAAVAITLSENARGYVWIAEVVRGDAREVVILPVARTPLRRPEAPLAIEKRLLVADAAPVLDAAIAGELLVVLQPAQVKLYRRAGPVWEVAQSFALPQWRAWPRDVRGRLEVRGASLQAWLPGVMCSGTLQPAAIQCGETDTAWPVEPPGAALAPGRNYFAAGGGIPFFSSARAGGSLVLAGARRTPPWGDDVAAVDSKCGSGRQVLTTSGSEDEENESVMAFEMSGGSAQQASDPLPFPGTVTALWPMTGGEGAVAVVREASSGLYAAYQLTLACGR